MLMTSNEFKKQNAINGKKTLYTCQQPLMMAHERSESIRDNFGKFFLQFQPEIKTLIRKLERILKNYIDKMCFYYLIIYIYIYIYIYIRFRIKSNKMRKGRQDGKLN